MSAEIKALKLFLSNSDDIAEFSAVSNDEWLNLDEAYQVAVERGYQSSKDAFRKLISRKPSEVRAKFGIVHESSRAGKGGKYKPYKSCI